MGRSIRSKIGKRLRTAKRQRADAMVYTPKLHEHHENLQKVIQGRAVTLKRPKNAFKYPEAEGAVFPQHEIMKPIDYRSATLPMAQYAFRGNRRKYTGEELEFMTSLAKQSHPKMEVLAGGGAILAKTGKKVSLKEAEILATAAVDPEAAAVATSGPTNSTAAVAAAVAEEEAAASATASSSAAPVGDVDMEADAEGEDDDDAPEPVNAVDHTRLPVVKDTRRAKRTAVAKKRANSTLKTKPKPTVGEGSASSKTKTTKKGKA